MEDVVALVEPCGHGSGVLQRVDRPLNFVPSPADRRVEADGPAALAASLSAVATRGIRRVATKTVRPRPGTPTVGAGDTEAFHDRNELWSVAPLARRDQAGPGAASTRTGEVDPAGRAAPGASKALIGAVLLGRASSSQRPRRLPACSGDVLVGPAGSGVHAHRRPVDAAFRVGIGQDGRESLSVRFRYRIPLTILRWLPRRPPR